MYKMFHEVLAEAYKLVIQWANNKINISGPSKSAAVGVLAGITASISFRHVAYFRNSGWETGNGLQSNSKSAIIMSILFTKAGLITLQASAMSSWEWARAAWYNRADLDAHDSLLHKWSERKPGSSISTVGNVVKEVDTEEPLRGYDLASIARRSRSDITENVGSRVFHMAVLQEYPAIGEITMSTRVFEMLEMWPIVLVMILLFIYNNAYLVFWLVAILSNSVIPVLEAASRKGVDPDDNIDQQRQIHVWDMQREANTLLVVSNTRGYNYMVSKGWKMRRSRRFMASLSMLNGLSLLMQIGMLVGADSYNGFESALFYSMQAIGAIWEVISATIDKSKCSTATYGLNRICQAWGNRWGKICNRYREFLSGQNIYGNLLPVDD